MSFSLGLRWEDPKQRYDKVHAQVGLEVGMWLATANGRNRQWAHIDACYIFDVNLHVRRVSNQVRLWVRCRAGAHRRQKRMRVRWDLIYCQRDLFATAS